MVTRTRGREKSLLTYASPYLRMRESQPERVGRVASDWTRTQMPGHTYAWATRTRERTFFQKFY